MKTLKEVKEKLEDIRGGGVDNKELNSYTEYNNLFIENYNEIFDYIEDNKFNRGISLYSIESVFEQVIGDFSRLAIDFIEENTNKKDTENINILIKSSLLLNCVGFTKILTTVTSQFFTEPFMRLIWPICNAPIVGTKPIVLRWALHSAAKFFISWAEVII